MQEIAKAFGEGVRYINNEEYDGVQGLRISKLNVMDVSEWMKHFYQGQRDVSWEIERPRKYTAYIY